MPERSSAPASIAADRLDHARRAFPQAHTLPAEAYTSPSVYDLEVERIFSREWLCAGRAEQIPEIVLFKHLPVFIIDTVEDLLDRRFAEHLDRRHDRGHVIGVRLTAPVMHPLKMIGQGRLLFRPDIALKPRLLQEFSQ